MLARTIDIALGTVPAIETPSSAKGCVKVYSGESKGNERGEKCSLIKGLQAREPHLLITTSTLGTRIACN